MPRPGVEEITTKCPTYLSALQKLYNGETITVDTAATLVGVTEKTMRQYATAGKFGARKVNNAWVFDPKRIKAEMGMEE